LLLKLLKKVVTSTIGDVAVEDAWKVEKLTDTQLLVKPGEAWFKGMPFLFRSGGDHLVSGAILAAGITPVGVTITDDATGLGKIITLNSGSTTPTNLYRLVITAQEELLTEIDDPFLKNANLSESTAQKVRLVFRINIVPDSLQTESPVPYRDENSTSLSVTNFPNSGGMASPNLVNQISVTPTAAGNGELIATNPVSGAEGLDGRDVELVLRNDSALGGGHPIPKSVLQQAAFSNGKLLDSNGNKYHINAIFNDTVSTQVVIRIDKEPDQPNPSIINTRPFTLVKREVFTTDDVNGVPQGKLYWPVGKLDWHQTNGIVHESSVTDLRNSVSTLKDYEFIANTRFDLILTDGGDITWNTGDFSLSWASAFTLVNPHGPIQVIPAGTTHLVDGGCQAYEMNLNGASIERGSLSVTVTSFGATSQLAPTGLSDIRVGNIIKDPTGGVIAEITAIDDVNDTITTSPALTANGSATIYRDSYGPGKAPLKENMFILAVRSGNKVYVGGLELENGEVSQLGDGTSAQTFAFIGSTGESDSSPQYSSNNFVVDGSSLVTAISTLDANLSAVSGTIRWKAPVANFAALPTLGNLDGDVRLTLDTRTAYTWFTTGAVWREIGHWKAPVANFAALPATGNMEGDNRIVLDTRIVYTWHTTGTQWLPINGTGGGQKIIGGGTLEVEAVDAGFNAGTGFTTSQGPQTLSLQSDGKLIGAGSFLGFNGLTRTRMVRLSPTGADDAAFYANLGTSFDGVVLATFTLSDDSILVGGGFNNFNGNARAKMVKLNSDGTEDIAFYTNLGTGFNDYITSIRTQSTGKIIVAGNFTSFNGNSRNRLVRLNADGTEDAAFYANLGSGFASEVDVAEVDASDKIVCAGVFTTFNGSTRNRLLRLNSDGTFDSAFYTNLGTAIAGGGVFSCAIQPSDGKILLGGAFTSLNGNTRNRLLRLNADGTDDTAFYTNLGTALDAQTNLQGIKVQADGKIVVVGAFILFNGVTRNRMIRLNSSGTEDTAFYTNLGTAFSGSLGPVILTLDQKIIATGTYATFNGATRNGIVKLTSTGVEESQSVTSFVELSFDADMFVEIKGLVYSDNTIDASESPLQFSNDLEVAYVIPNLNTGGPSLVVTIDTLDQVPANATIIARRVGSDIIVGSSSTRLTNGQSTELYAQESIQSRNTLRTTEFLRSNDPVTWTGTQLQFTADIILESLNVRTGATKLSTIQLANSPLVLADGQIAYVVIDRSTGSSNVTPVVASSIPTVTSENDEYVIIARRRDATGVGYIHIPLHKQVLEPGQTVRLGASGTGSGNANSHIETLKNRLLDSPFELVTPNIFEIDTDDKVDGASTGAFSLVSKDFELPVIGNTLVSTDMADPLEFLTQGEDIREVELLAFWNPDKTDPIATYEVSRNGGLEYQAVTMERVGTTETFRGIHAFDEEASNQIVNEYAVANADGTSGLKATGAGTELGQGLVLASTSVLRVLTLYMNKVESAGTLVGKLYVSVIANNAGIPSTDADDVLTESGPIDIDALSTGNISVIIDMPEITLVPGTYHIRLRTDAAYKASFSAGVRELFWRTDSSAPTAASNFSTFNSPTWTAQPTIDAVYRWEGIELDLRVRITSGTTDVALEGYGIFYNKQLGNIVTGLKQIEVFKFSGDDDETDFLINNFVVEPELLKVYDVNSGQVYRYGAFTINGNTVQFTAGQFDMPGENITLIFDQTNGGAFDNSDANAVLLATNHLGSTDPNYDKSVAGMGIFLKRPDGVLREIAIDNADNIVVYSV
jgi:uncharacterized delta-60 repeat protein